MKKNFETNNPSTRQVVCISTQKMVWGGENGERLTLNRVYNVTAVNQTHSSTMIYLKEFPGVDFNSVLFGEIN